MIKFIIIYIIFINIFTFCLYGIDKQKARKGKWRISEAMLLSVALLGGSLGAILAMKVFHHKTKHWKFKILVPLFLLIHMILTVIFLKG